MNCEPELPSALQVTSSLLGIARVARFPDDSGVVQDPLRNWTGRDVRDRCGVTIATPTYEPLYL